VLPALLGVAVFVLVTAGLFVPLETWFSLRGRPPSPRAVATCVGLLTVNTLAMQALGAPLLDAIESQLAGAPPPLWRLLAVFILADVAGYWLHRTMHRVPRLWRLHAVHHAPASLNWLEAWRQHPVDFVLHGIAVGLPGALLGASLAEFAGLVLLRKIYTSFLHADLSWRLRPLDGAVATPAFHHLHHSADPADHDHNFAGTFPFIDMLFGTYRRPRGFPAALGLAAPLPAHPGL
jgi:sterol desaturase/sphingolipid hydroxylase (fatty acid hydroxylase superfamily)